MKTRNLFFIVLFFLLLLFGCSDRPDATKPSVPRGVGYKLDVNVPFVDSPLPVVDYAENNGDDSTKYTLDNPIVKILYGFESIWSLNDNDWQNGGANGDGPDSFENAEIRNAAIWKENMQYVLDVTSDRTEEQAFAAYYDDRRDKSYSVLDGLGPLMEPYLEDSGAYTIIDYSNDDDFDINEEMTYTDKDEENIGLGSADSDVAWLRDLVLMLRQESPASTSGSKYVFISPRPWRMNDEGEVIPVDDNDDGETDLETIGGIDFEKYESNVSIVPALKVCRRKASDGRRKDGGYPSGHTNAGYLGAIGYAYAVPERFSELLTRASELGENRIVSGMHSPLDVIGGRIQSMAISAYAFSKDDNEDTKTAAYENAGEYFGDLAESNGLTLCEYAHTNDTSDWADHDANKALYRHRMTYGFSLIGTSGADPIVPKGAETLLETRQPYLTAEQRRAVLYTTEVDSGYPLLDDSNGW